MGLTFTRANSQYLTIPYNARMVVSAFTISAWVNPSTVTMQRVLSRVSAGSAASEVYGLDVYQNNCRVLMGKQTGTLNLTYTVDAAAGGSVPAGVWTYIAGTYDGSMLRAYVNGVQVASLARTAAFLTGTAALCIGGDYQSATNVLEFFDGTMEDVKLFNRALTGNELMTQFTTRGSDSATNGLILNIGMYEGSRRTTLAANSIVRDLGPYGFNATYGGSSTLTFTDCITRTRRSI